MISYVDLNQNSLQTFGQRFTGVSSRTFLTELCVVEAWNGVNLTPARCKQFLQDSPKKDGTTKMMDCDKVDGEPEIRCEVTTWDNIKTSKFCAHQLVQDFWTINSTTPRVCLGLDGGIIAWSWNEELQVYQPEKFKRKVFYKISLSSAHYSWWRALRFSTERLCPRVNVSTNPLIVQDSEKAANILFHLRIFFEVGLNISS